MRTLPGDGFPHLCDLRKECAEREACIHAGCGGFPHFRTFRSASCKGPEPEGL